MVHRLAVEAGRTGDDGRARELADESLVVNRRIGSLRGESQSLTTLGGVSFREGDHDRAFELLERAAALADESGFVWWSIGVRLTLAEYGLRAGRLDAARAWACQGLADAGAIEDRLRTVYGLGCLAWHAAATGLAERAGTLWGAIETEESRGPIGHWEGERGEYVAQLEAVRGPEFDEGSARGRRFSLDEAVRYALDPRGGGNS